MSISDGRPGPDPLPGPGRMFLAVAAAALFLATGSVPATAADGQGTIVVTLAASEHAAYQRALQSATAALLAALPSARVDSMTLEDGEEEASLGKMREAKPALILAVGSRAARLVHDGLPGTPLVYTMVLDPPSIGLPAPGEPPRGMATGVGLDVPLEDQFALMRTLLPSVRRIGVLYDPSISGDAVRKAASVARASGLRLVAQAVRSSTDVLDAAGILSPAVDAMLAIADPTVLTAANTRPLILFWLRAGKPLFAMSEGFVRNGALAALVPDTDEAGRRAGELAARILLGASPSSLKAEPPPRVSIFLNRASADHLGVVLTDQILARARQIFPER
jgi:putative tryptophan/tyrosine transport system substrate-binding protein